MCAEVARRFGTGVDLVHLHPPTSTTPEDVARARELLAAPCRTTT
jgi:hypothetical protein